MLLKTLQAVPSLLGAYLAVTGVFQLTLAQVSTARQKDFQESYGPYLIGGIIWTMCALMGVGFHFGSGGHIPLLPVFVLTLVFVHLDAIFICSVTWVTWRTKATLYSVLLTLLGLAVHFAAGHWLLRMVALTFTSLTVFFFAAAVIDLTWDAASSTLRRSDAGVDAVSSVLVQVCDAVLGVLLLFIALWTYFATHDIKSREFSLTSTSALTAVCLIDMCIFQVSKYQAPTLVHANRAISGVLLAFLEYVIILRYAEQSPLALRE